MYLHEHLFLVVLGICLGVDFLGYMVTRCITFEELSNGFPKWLHQFTFPPARYEGSNLSISCHHLLLSFFLITVTLVGVNLVMVLIFITFINNETEHLFM